MDVSIVGKIFLTKLFVAVIRIAYMTSFHSRQNISDQIICGSYKDCLNDKYSVLLLHATNGIVLVWFSNCQCLQIIRASPPNAPPNVTHCEHISHIQVSVT